VTDALPNDVVSLINRHLSSIDHVEVLLLLFEAPEGTENIEGISRRTRLAPAIAQSVIDDLVAADLATTDEGRYRYRPRLQHDGAVDGLRHAYHARPVTLVRAIYARPTPARPLGDFLRD
jgi:hypothetical protein